MKRYALALMLSLSLGVVGAQAQNAPGDSLTIGRAIALTLQNHPAVEQAKSEMDAAAQRIGVSRSGYYPDISLNGDYTRIDPVPAIDFPGEGHLEFAPHNNYNVNLGLRQTLYDFGRTSEAVQGARSSLQMSVDDIELVKFRLAYQTVDVFDRILILHQRIDVLDEQLQTLAQHLEMSVKRLKAGTATDFDTLTIQVKIAVANSDRIDALHALETQEIALRQLTGLPATAPIKLSGAFDTTAIVANADSLIAAANKQRPELVKARDVESNAESHVRLASLGNKPLLALNLSTGFMNGYEPNLNTWRGNLAANLQLKVPLFDGYGTKHRESAAAAGLNSAKARTSDIETQVRAEVLQAIAAVNSSLDKIAGTETQVMQAQQAVAMAQARYSAGTVTNLDLLDAETTLSQVKLLRLRALYDYTVSLNALDRATGRRVW